MLDELSDDMIVVYRVVAIHLKSRQLYRAPRRRRVQVMWSGLCLLCCTCWFIFCDILMGHK
jgi:hypothetical protein